MHNAPTPIDCPACSRKPVVESEAVGASTFWHVLCPTCGRTTAKRLFVSAPVAVMSWNRGKTSQIQMPKPIEYRKVNW